MKTKKGYKKIEEKIDTMESKLDKMNESLGKLKNTYSKESPPDDLEDEDLDPELCYDEIEADMAAYEAIRDICLEGMLDMEPVGEA